MKKLNLIIAFLFATLCSNAQNIWTQKTDFGGTGRYGAVGFSIGTKGYFGTGYDASGYMNDFWEWDQTTNVWTQKANFGGAARNHAVGFSIGTKGYIGTGVNGATYYQDFWEWDQSTNIWIQKSNFGGASRQQAVGFSIGTKGYIGTGVGVVAYKDFWEWNQSTNSWTQKNNFGGIARYGATGFSIGTKGYIGTGRGNAAYQLDFWEWNQSSNVWIQKANFGGAARRWAVGFSISTKGYIGIGDAANGGAQDFWEWDQVSNTWNQKINFGGTGRFHASGFSIGTKGYLGLGFSDLNDFWEYNSDPCAGFNANVTADGVTSFCQGGNITLTVNSANSYLWSNGATTQSISVSSSGSYTVTITNGNGCSSTASPISVIVNNPTSSTTMITSCDNYTWNNQTYTESGTYTYNAINAVGCDSSAYLNLTLFQNVISSNDTTICSGQSVTLSAGNASGTPQQTCSSNDLPSNLQSGLVAYYPFCGNAVDASGNGNNGTVNGATLSSDRFGNANSAYDFDGVDNYLDIGSATIINFSNNLTVTAWVNAETIGNWMKIIEQEDLINFWANHQFAISNNGQLLVGLRMSNSFTAYTYSSNSISTNQWYHVGFSWSSASNGGNCKLYINGQETGYVSQEPLTNDIWVVTPESTKIGADIHSPFEAFDGEIDDISIWNRALSSSEIQQLYQSSNLYYSWSTGDTMSTITVIPSQTTTYYLTVSDGTSSCTDSVTITVSDPDTSTTTIASCDSYTWNSQTYTQSGIYSYNTTNPVGCDSVAILNLTINSSSSSSTHVVACDSYIWNGVAHTTSGTFTSTGFINAAGCDSSATVVLTISSNTSSSSSVDVCDSYLWNNQNYTNSGIYTYSTLNGAGCDSTATLDLTIRYLTTSLTTIDVCDDFTWNGITYTTSGIYTYSTLNDAGCDSTATLDLTIRYRNISLSTVDFCDSYTWNSVTYTTSGIFTYSTLNVAGCDSTATLDLTIRNSTSSNTAITACDAYTWNGIPHTTSGIFTTTGFTNVAGCDSSATVVLTINNSTSSSEIVTACDFYKWSLNSVTYFSSGTYTYTSVNASGCQHISTLYLTIINLNVTATPGGSILCFGGAVPVNVSATGGTSPYTGTGSFNQAAVTQTYIVSDANGCSASASLSLTEPAKVEGVTSTSPANCGLTNGTATVIASGGTGTYSYLWSDGSGQTTATASSLGAGNYTVIITDGNSCTGTASATVTGVGVLPDPAGAISGSVGACRNTCIVYTVPPVSGATSYSWTLPPGATGSSGTNSITLCFDNTYAGGFLCVTASNTCGSSAQSCINIPALTVRPAQPGFVIGNQHPCGPNIHTYSIPASNNALNYNWSVTGSGVTILSGQGSNSVQVSIPTGFGQGSVSVNASNCIGTTSTRNLFLTGIPTNSNVLVGPSYVCANTNNVSYSISPVIGSSAYSWSVTGDMSIASSSGTLSQVNFGPAFTTGTISVTTSSPCGAFTRTYTIRSVPMQPGNIYGPGTNLCGQTGVTYSLDPVASATSYSWTVPAGVDITLNSGTAITVNFGAGFTGSGNICVSANNACGSSVARCYNVTAVPAVPTSITGPASVCKSSVINYTVSPVAGATFYSWYASNGVLISPIGTGLSADANFNYATAGSSVLTVRANNNCGISQPMNKTVSIDLNCREAKASVKENEIAVYPNPTRGKITIEFAQATKGKCILKVVDLLRNVLEQIEVKAEEGLNTIDIDLGSLSKGMYFIVMERDGDETKALQVEVQ